MGRLWAAFIVVMVKSFLVSSWIETRIDQEVPPLPYRVVSSDGAVLVDEGEIKGGKNVWQFAGRNGGQLGVGARQQSGAGLDCRLAES